ncbi:flagellar biosynthetic protein FliR [Liquorilactobacillus mali]|uniref:Flagellar biosynthetic protein FliR n=2 Tax=Liquorilactobacillus mali KCTC 3596 = DSM 20444 TaxID=1046596 RepID=J0UV64_9LACO|nr:flagellar biosynthetic protein FliR [Liquorilactobacillus mali]AJA34100.1 flagellar biosynthetic protein FliR [Liquorilactobacillus mali KCTC 3596 = DSM 20444]EJF02209.1 flagellar biosynthesis protein FliR [Liquorilactobacillus mali KCTC 3596 = DSM 20444]MDC7953962.1 flagellar biosynthetic protein FliR [Liquorilactobacillus mali]MDV7757469.1 flagellar biosynthetic protein FliR [Liquorilactobacillus mali]QFQ75618.1 flagellar biosynthetic protein FliR [Liquorilactobacillus mali]
MIVTQIGALLLCRVMSFIAICPLFSQKGFPNLAKLVVGGSLVISAYPAITGYKEITNMLLLGEVAIKEVLFGLAMGYLSQLVFSGVMMAGQMIDFQVGFSMAQAYDTMTDVQSAQFSKLYYWLTVSAFFLLDLQNSMIYGVVNSFKIVPLGTENMGGASIDGVVQLFEKTVEMSVSLSAPMVVAVLVIDILLGVISRSIPQINILMMSLSVKTIVGIIIFLLALSSLLSFLGNNLSEGIENMLEFIKSVR